MPEIDNENRARKDVDKHFEAYIAATDSINMDVIDAQLYKALDEHDLGLSNFWRLQSYYKYKYRRYLKKGKNHE